MTVKKALEVLEGYPEQKIKLRNGIKNTTKSWNIEMYFLSP